MLKADLRREMELRGLRSASKKRREMILEIREHDAARLSGRAGRGSPGEAAVEQARRSPLEPGASRDFSDIVAFGERGRPKSVVVLLHGLNDNARAACEGLEPWAETLAASLVVVPQAPDKSKVWTRADGGYDWLQQKGTHDTGDPAANRRELARVALARSGRVIAWLQRLLRFYELGADRLVLVGCSQGSILATMCGLSLGCAGVVVLGGVPGQPVYSASAQDYVGGCGLDWPGLVADRSSRTPRFCLVNGTRDQFVNLSRVNSMLSEFECTWYVDPGAGHDFPWRWYWAALEWMQTLLHTDAPAGAAPPRAWSPTEIRAQRLPADDAYGRHD